MKENILENGKDASSSFVTVPVDKGDLDKLSIHVIWSGAGTLAGTLTLESSNENVDASFVTISGSSQAVAASSNHMWSLYGQSYKYVRVRWAYTSGAGTAKIINELVENVINRGA